MVKKRKPTSQPAREGGRNPRVDCVPKEKRGTGKDREKAYRHRQTLQKLQIHVKTRTNLERQTIKKRERREEKERNHAERKKRKKHSVRSGLHSSSLFFLCSPRTTTTTTATTTKHRSTSLKSWQSGFLSLFIFSLWRSSRPNEGRKEGRKIRVCLLCRNHYRTAITTGERESL